MLGSALYNNSLCPSPLPHYHLLFNFDMQDSGFSSALWIGKHLCAIFWLSFWRHLLFGVFSQVAAARISLHEVGRRNFRCKSNCLLWDASSVVFWLLDLVVKHYCFLRKSTEILLVFNGKKKKGECSWRDPCTLYVSINMKVIVIMEVITSICGLIASINQHFANVLLAQILLWWVCLGVLVLCFLFYVQG